jgi:anthranilate phosphoribosyltransferase
VDLGLAPAIPDELTGDTPAVNAEFVRRVMAGEHGAHRNIVVLNAAAGLVVAGVADTLEDGLVRAMESIDSGKAAAALAKFVEVSQQAAEELGH